MEKSAKEIIDEWLNSKPEKVDKSETVYEFTLRKMDESLKNNDITKEHYDELLDSVNKAKGFLDKYV